MKLFLSLLSFLVTAAVVVGISLLQIGLADRLEEKLDDCLECLEKEDGFEEAFADYEAYYEKARKILTVFCHSDRIEELDSAAAEIRAALDTGGDIDPDRTAEDLSRLKDTANRVKESNIPSLGNIF